MKSKTPLAVITGAAGGIGRATTIRFLREGFRVAALDRSVEGLERLQNGDPELNGSAQRLHCYHCDLSDVPSLTDLTAQILEEQGSPRVLVNNAGIRYYAPITEIPLEAWWSVINVNLVGAAALAQKFVPGMKGTPGASIVNVASRNAFSSSPLSSTYDATKAGLVGLTRTLAVELGQYGIRVNAVCPGVIATPINENELADPDFTRNYLRLIPLDRFGTPEDIANVIFFLASKEAAFLTGQAIIVDGGQISGQNYSKLFDKNDWVPVNSFESSPNNNKEPVSL